MNAKKITAILCVTALLASLSACGSKTSVKSEASKKQIATAGIDFTTSETKENATVVKYSTVFASTGIQADGAQALGKLIAESSDGNMKMEFYPSSQLGDKIATFEGLQAGTIEMTECAATDLSAFDSMWSVFSLPYLWDSDTQAVKTVMDPEVRKILEKNMEQNGFKIIAWTDMGSRSFMNDKRVIKTAADLKGLKIRCMEDKVLADSVTAMGAIATPMAFSEVYTGIQQGTIDGLDHTASSLASSRFQEICKYYSLTEHFTIPDPVFVSTRWFNRLSKDKQEAIVKAGNKFTEEWNNDIWPQAEAKGIDELKSAGVEVTEVDKTTFKDAVKPVVQNFLANATDQQKSLYDLLEKTKVKYK